MKILISGNKQKEEFYNILEDIHCYLSENSNFHIYVDEVVKHSKILNLYKFDKISSIKNKYDLLICIGGDGAILSCVRRMDANQIPLIGVHIGNLGFLNHCNKNNYSKIFKKIFKDNKFNYTKHRLIKASFIDNNKKQRSIIALNDIVISQPDIPRLVNLDVYVGNTLLNHFNSDGVIFSTPLGSTAYSLSAGGPIISPGVDCLVITPVAPHTLSLRPIVVDSNAKIKILSNNNIGNISISSDGQTKFDVYKDSLISIINTNRYALFISIPGMNNYYLKLRKKIGWR